VERTESTTAGPLEYLASPDAAVEYLGRQLLRPGCPEKGAHSRVRKGLGLDFAGDAFPEQYMLGDVEVDWPLPTGYVVRSSHQTDGRTDDMLVCVPLPRTGRYRMSMLVPDDLATRPAQGEVQHGMETGPAPPTAPHPSRRRSPVARTCPGTHVALVVGVPNQPPAG
jgi:hypothetical protein